MLHRMAEEEIRIRKIENLRMVSLYEFTGAVRQPGERSNTDGTPRGCTAITVLCGENEQFTLSEMDPYFDALCDQTLTVYGRLPDRSAVVMDDATRAVMEAGISVSEDSFTERFYEMTGNPLPMLPYDACLSKRFLPLAEYIVGEMETVLERNGKVTDRVNGWRGKGLLQLHLGEEFPQVPVMAMRTGVSSYRMTLGGYPEERENTLCDITVQPDRMEVAFASEKSGLTGRWEFLFSIPYMETRITISRGGKEICYECNRFQAVGNAEPTEKEKKLLPEGVKPTVLYRLPWGVTFVLTETGEKFGTITRNHYQRSLVYPDAGYSETLSWSVIRNTESGVVLRKNNIRMIRSSIGDGRYQTYFSEAGGGMTGRYRTALAGKYFIS